MTLRQKAVLKDLPNHGYSLSKSMRANGYTKQGSIAGSNYEHLRRAAAEVGFFSKEAIERDISETRNLAKKKQSIANLCRIDEHRAKIGGLITEKHESDVNLKTNETTDVWKRLRQLPIPSTN